MRTTRTTPTVPASPMLAQPAPPDGWRDHPVEDDPCVSCDGWGTKTKWRRVAAPETKEGYRLEVLGLETCPRCLGTGRRRLV